MDPEPDSDINLNLKEYHRNRIYVSDRNPLDEKYQEVTHKSKPIVDLNIDLSFLNNLPSESLVEDNGVIKYLYQPAPNASNLECPKALSQAQVLFEFRNENGELIDKYRNRKELKSMKLFSQADFTILGMHYAIMSMKKGEISWFKIAPEYHYGLNGLPDQGIEPGKSLYLKVELKDFKLPKTDVSNIKTLEEYLKVLEESRQLGTIAYKEKDYKKALKEYSKGANLLYGMPKALMENVKEEMKRKVNELGIILNNNTAMASIKENDYEKAKFYSDRVLKLDENNIKGLFRRGIANKNLKHYDDALSDFQKCLDLDSQGEIRGEIVQNMKEIYAKKKEFKEKEMNIMKKVFEKLAESQSEAQDEVKDDLLGRKVEESLIGIKHEESQVKHEEGQANPEESLIKPGESQAKHEESQVKFEESKGKSNENLFKVEGSQVKPGERKVKLEESKIKAEESVGHEAVGLDKASIDDYGMFEKGIVWDMKQMAEILDDYDPDTLVVTGDDNEDDKWT